MENNDGIRAATIAILGFIIIHFWELFTRKILCMLISKINWYLACLYIKKTSESSYSAYIALNKVHLYILEILSGTFCQASDFTWHQIDLLAWGWGMDQNICVHSQIRRLNQFSCLESLFLSASRTLST